VGFLHEQRNLDRKHDEELHGDEVHDGRVDRRKQQAAEHDGDGPSRDLAGGAINRNTPTMEMISERWRTLAYTPPPSG
jgi:hypothetical protein